MTSERERLLVVDDDPELLKLQQQALCDAGFDCHKAADGREALSQLRQAGFDLVVLDWTLPQAQEPSQAIFREFLNSGEKF